MGPRLLAYNETGSLEHLKPKPERPKTEAQEQPKEQAAPAEVSVAAAESAAEPSPAETTLEPIANEAPAAPTNGVEEHVAPA
jgi:probable phosphoglycerate mutase